MAKLSVETFLEYLRKSELTDESALEKALRRIRANGDPETLGDAEWLAAGLVKAGLITNWHVRQLMKRKHKGFYLRQYRILGHIGTGGMSTVYLAEHTLMQRRVAIKVLPKKRLANAMYLDRFVREAQAIASLDHPHIVRAYDIDRYEDIHYIVMEYFEGQNLRQFVEREGPLPYEDAVGYIRQAADGLVHAHRIGIIHRDIKPENLLANESGMVKILDLGLALLDETLFNQAQSSFHEDKILGTADYLAPEQALDSNKIDARADIYSLGCTLYFCLTGHAPFPFGTIPQRLLAHQRETPASIFNDRPDAPNDLVEICNKMMAKRAQDRYQSAAEVAQILGRWLVHHGFAEAKDFPGGLGETADLTKENPEDDEFFSSELSFLRETASATGLDSHRETIPGDSGIFGTGIGNEAVVDLFGSGSRSGVGAPSSGGREPKEILLSKNLPAAKSAPGYDPLALALNEIETSKQGKSDPTLSGGASETKTSSGDDSGRHLRHGTSGGSSGYARPRGDTGKRNRPAETSHTSVSARNKEGLKLAPGVADDSEWFGHWVGEVPVWFWVTFGAGYVLATFLAGILFTILTTK